VTHGLQLAAIICSTMALACPSLASAQDTASDGEMLLNSCGSGSGFGQGVCLRRVAGFIEGYKVANTAASGSAAFCMPSSARYSQAADVLVAYLKAHPELHHLDWISLMLAALNSAWPCGNGVTVKPLLTGGVVIGPASAGK
jgi:hypothetical protein